MAGNLVKTVTLAITGEIRDAAAKVGLIRKDWQALADKSPVELKAELTGSEEVKLRLKEIEANAERLKKEFPEFTAKLDTAAAIAKLAVLRAEIRKTADTGRTLSDRISGIGTALGKATPAWTGFLAAGLALGPALLPVLAAVTGATIGLGAAVTGAGAAVGIFALAAKSNLTDLQKELTKVQAANKSAALAEQTAAGKRTAAQKQAIVNARDLTKAFQKEFGAEYNAIEKLKSSWTTFTTQPVVTNAIAQGAKLLTAALPHLLPLLKLGALAVNVFTSSLLGFVNTGGLDRMVKGLVNVGKPAIIGFVNVLHNLAIAFGALSGGASKFAGGVIDGLVRLSAAFAAWATNKGPGALTGLMDTIRKLGPGVLALVKDLAAAVPNLAKGLFPLAPLSLALSTALAGLIAHVSPHVITALATAFIAVYSAIKLASGITAIFAAREAIAAAATKLWAAGQWLLNAALDANPIGIAIVAIAALTAGIILLYKHSALFRAIVKDTWSWIKDHWPLLLGIIAGPIGIAATLIIKHWRGIWDGVQAVWNWIRGRWPLLLGILTGPVGAAVTFIVRHWGQIVSGAQVVMNWFRGIWQNLTHLLSAPFRAAKKVIHDIWKTILGWIHDITGALGGGGGLGHQIGGTPGQNAVLARRMMPSWSTGSEWAAWTNLNMRESGWNNFAENKSSGAYGIPQALPPTKMPFAAQKAGGSHAGPQIGWQIGYIGQRYRDPVGAWAHENAFGWYDGPGPQFLPTGWSAALNTTGGPERVLSPGEERGIEKRLDRIARLLEQIPSVQAAQLGRVLSGRPVAPRPSVFAAR